MALRILLVDDSNDERRIVRVLLNREVKLSGYAVEFIEARDGEEGLEHFRRDRPHLVVSDLLMPRMDGFELCKAIRATPEGRETPMLVVSGFFRDKSGAEALKRDHNVDVIAKPVDARELLGRVQELLDGLKLARPELAEEWRQSGERREAEAPAAAPAQPASPPSSPGATPAGRTPPPIELVRPLRGTLSEHPLGFLLVHAAAAGSTGTLKLVRGKVRKLIHINKGVPVFVDSNLRSEALGSYLVAHGLVDENQLARALKQARAASKKLGETLVQMDLLDERQVLTALAAQTRIKLARSMIWPDGMFSFLPGDDWINRVPHCPVDAVEVVLGALKKMTRAADLSELLGPQLDQAMELTEAGEAFKGKIEQAFDAVTLHRAIAGASLQRLADAGMDLPSLLVVVDALLVSGLGRLCPPTTDAVPLEPGAVPMAKIAVRRVVARPSKTPSEEQPAAPAQGRPAAEPEPRVAPGPEAKGPRLEDLASTAPLASEPTDDIELFEPGEQVPPIYVEPEDSGVMQVPDNLSLELEEPGAAPPQRSRTTSDVERLREQLLNTYLRIHSRSHYEALGVDPDAAPGAIEAGYKQKLEELSTDRYRGALQEEEEDKLIELNLIIEQAHAVLSDPAQRASYDETLARARAEVEPTTDAYGAELFYQEGHALLKQHDLAGAVAAFRRATQENPDQPDYHAYLGWALFLSKGRGAGGAEAARPHLEHALRISPESVRALEFAGWVERDAGASARALGLLSRALKLGPPRLDLFEAVKSLLSRLEDHRELEHQFRRMIFRLRTKEPMKTVPLWVDLAYLYLNKLKQPDNARLALEVAGKLAPNDPRVRAALNASGAAQTQQQWRQVAEGYRRQVTAEPDNLEPLHDLFQLHAQGSRPDEAFVAAAVLVHGGLANEQEQRLCAEQGTDEWIRPSRAPTAEELQRIRHPDDLEAVEQLMATLAAVTSAAFPVTLEEHGSAPGRRIDEKGLPEPFGAVVRFVAEQLDRPVPPLFGTGKLGAEMAPLPGEPRMLVGDELLASADETRIAFAAGGALYSMPPGRRNIFGRRGTQLKVVVLGTLAHCRPGMTPPDPDGAIAAFREQLERGELDREELGRLVGAVLVQDSKINLSQWMRAIRCTAARVGLLFCTDIRPALAAVAGEPHTCRDLIGFALGEPYLALRRALGISVG